jgi:hypothetical protein
MDTSLAPQAHAARASRAHPGHRTTLKIVEFLLGLNPAQVPPMMAKIVSMAYITLVIDQFRPMIDH